MHIEYRIVIEIAMRIWQTYLLYQAIELIGISVCVCIADCVYETPTFCKTKMELQKYRIWLAAPNTDFTICILCRRRQVAKTPGAPDLARIYTLYCCRGTEAIRND